MLSDLENPEHKTNGILVSMNGVMSGDLGAWTSLHCYPICYPSEVWCIARLTGLEVHAAMHGDLSEVYTEVYVSL